MNKEYKKIPNMFKFDEKYRRIIGINQPFKALEKIVWIGTEKIDGTNTRVYWDGHDVEVSGHTVKTVFPQFILDYLGIFKTQEMEYVFEQMFGEKEVTIYGETYGNKVQANGEKYIKDGISFIVFDIIVDGSELSRAEVNDIAGRLGLNTVPIVFTGTLAEAMDMISEHPASTINPDHEMEGLVLTPCVALYDHQGNRISCKLKYMDMKKGGLCEQKL